MAKTTNTKENGFEKLIADYLGFTEKQINKLIIN